MPIYARPDSPPPRAPSPVLVHIPLPSPPPRNRGRVASPRQARLRGHSKQPGLHQLTPARSYDHMSSKESNFRDLDAEEPTRKRTRSTLTLPSPILSHSLSIPAAEFKPRHRRSLSFAIPYRSPPASPTIALPPPPVPPIPTFVLTSPQSKPTRAYPSTLQIAPIYLPEIDELSPLSETDTLVSSTLPEPKSLDSSQQKRRGVGMTCLKFFTLRNSRSDRNAAV